MEPQYRRVVECPKCGEEVEVFDPDDDSAVCEHCDELVFFELDEEG